MSKKTLAIATVLIAIIIDQTIKIYVKTNFFLGEEVEVFNWFKIHFVENNGMALGIEFGGKTGKFLLTLFRLIALMGIIYWLMDSIKDKINKQKNMVFGISLILAGAVGNIIDSVFYGVIFDDSTNNVATFFSKNPYGKFFHGKVVDMFYFPIFEFNLPNWIPFFGGDLFVFFKYIFNPADTFITVGVIILIIFNKQGFSKLEKILDPKTQNKWAKSFKKIIFGKNTNNPSQTSL